MDRLQEVKAQILMCTRCELSSQCQSPIPLSIGSTQTVEGAAQISTVRSATNGPDTFAVLGEAPGRIEDVKGKAFVGPAGRILRRELEKVKLDANGAVYMNVVCCWPKGTPSKEHLGACRENLKAQLEVCPDLMLVCGRVALSALLPHARLQYAAGKLISVHGKHIFPIVHPSYFIHRPSAADTYSTWKEQLRLFAFYCFWGEFKNTTWDDRCIYCPASGFPACSRHYSLWITDNKWDASRKRSKKKGLQDESLF